MGTKSEMITLSGHARRSRPVLNHRNTSMSPDKNKQTNKVNKNLLKNKLKLRYFIWAVGLTTKGVVI